MAELKGRVAVVTGAGSGIGLGLARRLREEGMKLVLADIDQDALEEARKGLGGADTIAVRTDVAKPAEMEALGRAALDAFGAVHVLCNNAGVSVGGPVWEASEGDWDWVLGVNLRGMITGLRVFMPIILEQDWGHVVNTASSAGLIAAVLGPYSVSKHAAVALSESLHLSLRSQGANVGVSVLCPGWVRTRIVESDRNRPREYGPGAELRPEQEAIREVIQGLVDGGMETSEVADHVVRAIHDRRFYVLTHESTRAAIESRFEAVLSGNPPDFNLP